MSSTNIEVLRLKQKVSHLETTVAVLEKQLTTQSDKSVINKDGLPVGLDIFAEVDGLGEVWLRVARTNYQVKKIGNQKIIQGKRFKSLSASAEFFSKIKRKSGWVYWRTHEGRTLKDTYKG